jgi:hypothetical protein
MLRTSTLRELRYLLRVRNAEGLRAMFVDDDSLGGALGLHDSLLRDGDDAEVLEHVGRTVTRFREEHQSRRLEEARVASARAAVLLRETAQQREGGLGLDAELILGPLLADSSVRFIEFVHQENAVAVRRQKLLELRRISRRLPGLRAAVDAEALRFRWRGGKGGLDLRGQYLAPHERRLALHVHLDPERPALVQAGSHPEPPAISGPAHPREAPHAAWFAQALTELAFTP